MESGLAEDIEPEMKLLLPSVLHMGTHVGALPIWISAPTTSGNNNNPVQIDEL